MNTKFERKLLMLLMIFGLVMTPLSILGRNRKTMILAFLMNAYTNIFAAPVLHKEGYLRYPVRFFPKYFQSSIIYDYCLCSLVTVWFCRATMKDNWKRVILKVWLFAIPQAIVERWLEKNTQLVKYSKGWTWIHSLLAIALAKLNIKFLLSLVEKFEIKSPPNSIE